MSPIRSAWFCIRCGRAQVIEHLDTDSERIIYALVLRQHEDRQRKPRAARSRCLSDSRLLRVSVGSTDITTLREAVEEELTSPRRAALTEDTQK